MILAGEIGPVRHGRCAMTSATAVKFLEPAQRQIVVAVGRLDVEEGGWTKMMS